MILVDKEKILNIIKLIYLQKDIPVDNFINIAGVRNDASQPDSLFNDYLFIWNNANVLITWGTTDPSWLYTKEPMNKAGTAHLCLGYHKDIWKVGIHAEGKKSAHEALIQVNPCKFWRDSNKDGVEAGEKYYNDVIGLDFHSTKGDNKTIGLWSAACQVSQMMSDHLEFMKLIKLFGDWKTRLYSYYLMNKSEFHL